jgi:tetratricopeptide (TPR) repeat protein
MLMTRGSLDGLSDEAALRHIDRLSEASIGVRKADGLMKAIGLAGELIARRTLRPAEEASVHFALAEAWEKLRVVNRIPVEVWEQDEVERELYHLRLSMPRGAVRDIPRERLCQSLSNMAALLNHVGRFSEAIEHWDRALSLMPSFAMARGKRGYALTHYAQTLYDRAQASAFLKCAHAELGTSLRLGLYDKARGYFESRLRWIEARISPEDLASGLALDDYSEGFSEEEALYRRWCLDARLFLNPLNDLGPFPVAGRDTLQLPHRDEYYQGFFSQMKHAFVSARSLYYEGLNVDGPDFSGQGMPEAGRADEKITAAYRIAYGLTGKIAGFLEQYLSLGIPEDRLGFRTLWYNGQRRADGLRPEFAGRRNWPLRGLFWLSKELSEDAPGALIGDGLVHSVRRGELEAQTLRVMKLVRSALVYLALAVHIEERGRNSGATLSRPVGDQRKI